MNQEQELREEVLAGARRKRGGHVDHGWGHSEWLLWPWWLPCPTPCDWGSLCLSVCLDIQWAQDALVK